MLMHNILCNSKDTTAMDIDKVTTIIMVTATIIIVTAMGITTCICMAKIIIGITMGSTDM
jgi:hypothetical protein